MRGVLAAGIVLLLGMGGAAAQPAAQADAAAHVGKGVRLMQDRLYGDAAAEFEQALAANPNDDEARIQYATCLFAEERNADARKQFDTVRQRLGSRPGLEYYLGRLDVRAGDNAAAIRRLAPLERNPAFPKASLYLGLAYQSAGQPARALECLERAARDNPRDPETHYRLGRVYSMAARADDANRQYDLYREWRENQRVAEQYGRDCMNALDSGSIEAARTVCQRIADPNDSRRLTLLGQLYSEHGAFADAIEPLRQAVNVDPEAFEAWQTLGLSLFRLTRYQEALAALRKAAGLNPRYFNTLTLLASTLHALGDDAGALPVLERAHELNPGDAQVTLRMEQLRAASQGKR
jgi:tetratricopeptide (TPR) repeat protein